jgi:hypothetical protein
MLSLFLIGFFPSVADDDGEKGDDHHDEQHLDESDHRLLLSASSAWMILSARWQASEQDSIGSP